MHELHDFARWELSPIKFILFMECIKICMYILELGTDVQEIGNMQKKKKHAESNLYILNNMK